MREAGPEAPGGSLASNGGEAARAVPSPPDVAAHVFGPRLPLAEAYVRLLADSGVGHGLIGPREVPRLWERHVLNCGVVGELIDPGAVVVDIGSGAGLPGIPLAIARPDLRVVLVEPLLRRTRWLAVAIAELGLDDTVSLQRGKAEAFAGEIRADVATSRAVSRLANLAVWSAPLLRPGGTLLALKGTSAADEVEEDRGAMEAAGLREVTVLSAGAGLLDPPTTVVRAVRAAGDAARRGRRREPMRVVRNSRDNRNTGNGGAARRARG